MKKKTLKIYLVLFSLVAIYLLGVLISNNVSYAIETTSYELDDLQIGTIIKPESRIKIDKGYFQGGYINFHASNISNLSKNIKINYCADVSCTETLDFELTEEAEQNSIYDVLPYEDVFDDGKEIVGWKVARVTYDSWETRSNYIYNTLVLYPIYDLNNLCGSDGGETTWYKVSNDITVLFNEEKWELDNGIYYYETDYDRYYDIEDEFSTISFDLKDSDKKDYDYLLIGLKPVNLQVLSENKAFNDFFTIKPIYIDPRYSTDSCGEECNEYVSELAKYVYTYTNVKMDLKDSNFDIQINPFEGYYHISSWDEPLNGIAFLKMKQPMLLKELNTGDTYDATGLKNNDLLYYETTCENGLALSGYETFTEEPKQEEKKEEPVIESPNTSDKIIIASIALVIVLCIIGYLYYKIRAQ